MSITWTLAGVTVGFLVLVWRLRRRAEMQRLARLAQLQELELLPVETSQTIMMSPSTSTATFFSGCTSDAEAYFASRVAEVVAANPWLASRLERGPRGIAAYFDQGSACSSCRLEILADLSVSQRGSRYEAIVRRLEPATCAPSGECVGNGRPLFRAALVPDAGEPAARFALVLSASHSLLDGHGFYAIANMIMCADIEVRALNPVRRFDMPAKISTAIGGESSLLSNPNAGFLLRFLAHAAWNAVFPATHSIGFRISKAWIADRKAEARTGLHPDYVSTNDVVLSCIFNLLGARLCCQTANFRNRVENGCEEDEVGNYEEFIGYAPENYDVPILIRRSVLKNASGAYVRSSPARSSGHLTPLMSTWEHLISGTYAVATNWTSFKRRTSVPCGTECLHLPLFNFNASVPPSIMGALCIFRAAEGVDAVLVAGSKRFVDSVSASPMVERWEELDALGW